MKQSPPEEYIEATPASRRKLAALLVVGLAGGFVTLEFLLPEFLAFVRTLPLCHQLDWVEGLMLALLAAIMITAPWFAITARKILRHDQWPLPGMLVWLRTRVQRGPHARWRAYVLLASSAAVLVGPPLMAYSVHDWVSDAQARRCAPERAARGISPATAAVR